MSFRIPRIALVVLAVFVLSACSATESDASSAPGGMVEMAVSETCIEGAGSECVSVNGANVLLPSEFEQVGVRDASIADNGQDAIDVTFNEDGAKVFHSLTEQAAEAGDSARLVIRIGDELQAAVVVMEALQGDQVQIGLSADDDAQEIVDLIQGG